MWETVRSESGKKTPSIKCRVVRAAMKSNEMHLTVDSIKKKVFLKGRKSWNCHQRHNFFFFFSPFCISEWGEPILLGSGFNKTLTVSPLFLFQHFLHVFLNPPDGHLYPGAPCLNCHSKVLDVGEQLVASTPFFISSSSSFGWAWISQQNFSDVELSDSSLFS